MVILDEYALQADRGSIRGTLRLQRGALRFSSSSTGMDVRIETRAATINVRGTVFDILASAQATEVMVHTGTVDVESRSGSRTLKQGQVLRVSLTEGFTASERPSSAFRQKMSKMATQLGAVLRSAMASAAPVQTGPIAPRSGPEDRLYLELEYGRVVIEMRPDLAPRHVSRIKELVREGFYDGLLFHKVDPEFTAETGDPNGSGRGGSGQTLPPEFSREPFRRGSIGMTRSRGVADSADSQFFICFEAQPHLDGRYTIWGRVVEGMEFVEQLRRGDPPRDPDRIVSLRLAAEVSN